MPRATGPSRVHRPSWQSRRLGLVLLVATSFSGVAAAQTTPVAAADGPIERLKPGEYLWAPQIAPAGPVTVVVSLKTQRAYAYRNGVAIGVSTVSTGTKGNATPTGVFTVLQKDADHVSNVYKDAAMPFMQRLTWGGIAMHAGHLPGYPASHGCIRMPLAFAKLLFGITHMGVTVVITRDALVPVVVTTRALLQPADPSAGAGDAFMWRPQLSKTGPVSIVVSGRDRKLVVLRNGIEIGSSAIVLDAPITSTAAFTLQSIDPTGEHWLRLPLPGDTGPGVASDQALAMGHLPVGFHAALATILVPGTTLLMTRETLASAGTGTPVTLIETDGP